MAAMPGPAERERPCLQHVFVPGLRFDTELQFLACDANGRERERWRRLAMPMTHTTARAALAALVQACALVTGRAPAMRGSARTAAAMRRDVTAEDLLRWAESLAPELIARRCSAGELPKALLQGPTPLLLCLKHPNGMRWALVTGVEKEHGGQSDPRALLLLDSTWAAPWATGHNARLELRHAAHQRVYRGLDGEFDTIEITGFIELTPRPSAGARIA